MVGESGVAAVEKKEYVEEVRRLDEALKHSTSPTWLLDRSKAHQHLGNFTQALCDVDAAYHSAVGRGSDNTRSLIIDAQYRRAVILFAMGRYADADCCARWSQNLADLRPANEDDGVGTGKDLDGDGFYNVTEADARTQLASRGDSSKAHPNSKAWNRAWMWRCQALAKMEKLPAGDPGRRVTVTKIPARSALPTPTLVSTPKSHEEPDLKPLPLEKSILRTDFYQTSDSITVSLFTKGVDLRKLHVYFTEDKIHIGPLPRDAVGYRGVELHSTLHLESYINPQGSRYSVTPNKVELVLQKKAPGVKWAKWGEERITHPPSSVDDSVQTVSASVPGLVEESSTNNVTEDKRTPVATPKQPSQNLPVRSVPSAAVAGGAPSYPTSSKTGPKNWDMLEDSDEEEDAKQDVDQFFKKLYSTATDEQRRAMMKSFVESNGTTLSTNWEDVGSRKVTTAPPDGVEPKKW